MVSGVARFYHCFPRAPSNASLSTCDLDEIGLKILEQILRFGLLLTPEELEIPPNPLSDLDTPPLTRIIQRRACFTLVSREELYEGPIIRQFGEFAIALDSHEARELGIVPTLYYYKPDDAQGSS